ncbi:dihydrofolate reductase [Ferruginibacter lapsinanis]|uniref:dihydrofolate reductase n=1 Tax=Ferruginibacter lapsinanis TaxID=563172 RepID=UPI001E2E34E2|nr:dihydrofolate reductase [Ferruginibacter lapsinanis]UEG51221.1 dihydrofolate reductase [Ferruginibacter lapsinanis]
MTISFVVAASENNAIGKDNQLLWHLPNDMRFFKNTTWGSVVIMGRKSFESMGKALKGRINIVITRQDNWQAEDTIVAKDLQDALKKAEATNCKEIFIIGGGEIYKQSLGIADKIYLTRVHTRIDGDTFFPELDQAQWELVSKEDFKKDEKHLYDYSFQILVRK